MSMMQTFHEIRQNVWLKGIPLSLLDNAEFRIALEAGVASGLVFNTSAFEWAIKNSRTYDASIRRKLGEGFVGEELFLELAVEDARKAADLLRFIYDETDGADGWVSLDVSPRTFDNPSHLAKAAAQLYGRVRRPNVMIKVPGTKEGNIAVVEAVSVGVPVNITNLYSAKQFSAAVEAYLKGVEQRLKAGLKPDPGSAVSLCLSPVEAERIGNGSIGFSSQHGVAIFRRIYDRWRALVQSPRWRRACRDGVRPLRLLCEGFENNSPDSLKALTVKKLPAPFMLFSMHEKRSTPSIKNKWNYGPTQTDEKDSEKILSPTEGSGVDIEHLAEVFQKDAVSLFVKKWFDLMTAIAHKSATLIQVGR
jgi:transaldolase